ncbi:hypothetical protein KL930_004425 [Ogataea haglerorum]|uniref:CMP/dCMP-type deaminase domain-containing protein n=1 Tax=Ogataea haglerorum TaxID=1937702 RepID=A0AAN6D2J7_9ASCO|nr:uncharacterized protein KL911_004779 [Ogataea haglerorum]KAG7703538.1 hypothetical protein KL950_004766 [Ogataea haglerorum]KAG7725319.1 hypothetical protein KL933_004333 [Ogataea haglerorum]KAG7735547.1 hypothetical protein KL932_004495 [Ogataea haglerorum]KAG7736498.1 hypothetical protein KL923_004705 [Ogataea haglerorum]KAG7746473.1 hypothetical protein KL912_004404 [Ogataea haglerorum]
MLTRSGPSTRDVLANLRICIAVAQRAKAEGRHPFGCILVGPSGEVLLEQGNVDTFNHAESTLCREAFRRFGPEFLWNCTLYTTFEPCCMCAGSAYWANIGQIVYGVAETRLLEVTGAAEENMTMSLSCREVIEAGQKPIRVVGPVAELEAEILHDHQGFWRSDNK